MAQSAQVAFWASPLLNLGVVVLGWWVLYGNAKRIASRAETRSLLDRVLAHIRLVGNEAREFWLRKGASGLTAEENRNKLMRLQSELQALEQYFGLLQSRGIEIDIVFHMKNLRREVTRSGEELALIAPERAFAVVERIDEHILSTTMTLEQSFINRYVPSK